VVVGNPPFQASKSGDYSLWARFIQKAIQVLKKDGYMAFIVPQGWLSPTGDIREGRKSILRDYFHKLDVKIICLDPTKFENFKVGSTFSYFVIKNSAPSPEKLTKFYLKDSQLDISVCDITFLPKQRINDFELAIRKKLKTEKQFPWVRQPVRNEGEIFSLRKKKYPIINGNSRITDLWFSSHKPKNFDRPKVIVPYNGEKFRFVVDSGCVGYGNTSVLFLTSDQIIGAKSYFSSKLVKWFLPLDGSEKYTQYNEPAYLRMLPFVDLSIEWTDQKIYEHFNLTKKEIQYIENTIKSETKNKKISGRRSVYVT
jgi:hypothetical protein